MQIVGFPMRRLKCLSVLALPLMIFSDAPLTRGEGIAVVSEDGYFAGKELKSSCSLCVMLKFG